MSDDRIRVILLCPLQNPSALPGFIEACVAERVELIAVHGPACEAVHDEIDNVLTGDELTGEERFIATTWHPEETLEEVIEFASTFGGAGIIRQVQL